MTGPDLCLGKSQVGGQGCSHCHTHPGEMSSRKAGQCVVWREVWIRDLYWGAAATQVTPEEDEGELGVVGADCGNARMRR